MNFREVREIKSSEEVCLLAIREIELLRESLRGD